MKLEPEKARVTLYVDRNLQSKGSISGINLGVKIDGKLHEIEYVFSPIVLDNIVADNFVTIRAVFGVFDLETIDEVQ